MAKSENNFLQNIPEVEYLESRFVFIENATLKTNLSISLQYVTFLIMVEEEFTLQGPISYSLYKNIILHTASIVEGTLHHLLEALIKRKEIDSEKVLGNEEIYVNKKVLYKTEDGLEVCGIHIKKKPVKLKRNTNFVVINRACKKAILLSKKLFEDVENLREQRNKIHLAGLSEVDDLYEKKDIQKAFDTAKEVLDLAERKLNRSS